jgi:hypothetical protein
MVGPLLLRDLSDALDDRRERLHLVEARLDGRYVVFDVLPLVEQAEDTPSVAELQALIIAQVAYSRSPLHTGEVARALDLTFGVWAYAADGRSHPLAMPSAPVALLSLMVERVRQASAEAMLLVCLAAASVLAAIVVCHQRYQHSWQTPKHKSRAAATELTQSEGRVLLAHEDEEETRDEQLEELREIERLASALGAIGSKVKEPQRSGLHNMRAQSGVSAQLQLQQMARIFQPPQNTGVSGSSEELLRL